LIIFLFRFKILFKYRLSITKIRIVFTISIYIFSEVKFWVVLFLLL